MKAPTSSWTVAPAADALWERGLSDRLSRHAADAGGLGELEAIAMRLGLIQRSLEPELLRPQLVLALGDHGLATDGAPKPLGLGTAELLKRLCAGRMPLNALARQQGLALTVLDVGVADPTPSSAGLLVRKIAHGTRHSRLGPAMGREQAVAAMRIGSELLHGLPGNVVLCAGLGVGAAESAALVLSRLTDAPVRELLLDAPARISPARANRLLAAVQAALARHPDVRSPVDVLAAFGGFEIAALAGLMMSAAQSRRTVVVDGMPALAALMVASRLAPPVVDFCIFARSQGTRCLDQALSLFRAKAVLDVGLDGIDGTGAALSWPLINSAAVCLAGYGLDAVSDPSVPTSGHAQPRIQSEMQFLSIEA